MPQMRQGILLAKVCGLFLLALMSVQLLFKNIYLQSSYIDPIASDPPVLSTYYVDDQTPFPEQPLNDEPQPETVSTSTSANHVYYKPVGDKWIVNNSDICSRYRQQFQSNFDLLLFVSSAARNRFLRDMIRKTWLPPLRWRRIVVLFFVGRPDNGTMNELMAESDKYGDIVVHSYEDTYRQLVYGTVAMLEWTQRFCAPSDFGYSLWGKSDDDVFINAERYAYMVSFHRHVTGSIIGYLHTSARVIRDAAHRWYVDAASYQFDTWPPYVGGFHYLMSAGLVQPIYRLALATPLIPLEDVFVTGVLASAAKVKHRDFALYFYTEQTKERNLHIVKQRAKKYIVMHKMSPYEINLLASLTT